MKTQKATNPTECIAWGVLRGSAYGRRNRIRAESARAYFSFRELPCYLSKENLPLLQKFVGERDSIILFVKDMIIIIIFEAMISQFFTFLIFFLSINNFFKTIAYSLSQRQ